MYYGSTYNSWTEAVMRQLLTQYQRSTKGPSRTLGDGVAQGLTLIQWNTARVLHRNLFAHSLQWLPSLFVLWFRKSCKLNHFILFLTASGVIEVSLLPSMELSNLWRGMLEKKSNFQLARQSRRNNAPPLKKHDRDSQPHQIYCLWRRKNEWRFWNGGAYTEIPRSKLQNATPKNVCIMQRDMVPPSH